MNSLNKQDSLRKVLIVSSHPLFGKGIQHLLETNQGEPVAVIGIVKNLEDAIHSLQEYQPDLVVVDYDDEAVNRDEFLVRFVESESKLRVVLLSLKEGGSNAIVYDRRNLAASQIDEWLQEWTAAPQNHPVSNKKKVSIFRSGKRIMKTNYKHVIGVMIFIVILTIFGLVVLQSDQLLPEAASLQALPIDGLFSLEFKATAVLFGVIIGALIYSVLFFRRKPGDTEDPIYQKGDISLNITWVVIPVGALFAFFVFKVSPTFEKLYLQIFSKRALSFDWAAAILSVLFGLIIFFILFGTRSSKSSQEQNAKENSRLEIAWIALPLGLVLLLSFAGSDALAQTLRKDPKPLVVNVTGQQWSWSFEYPEQGIVSDELVLPVSKQVLLKLTATDVLHSFWVPEFRVKQDLVPGEEKELRITPSKEGSYLLMCAEICGTRHAYMNAPVIVKNPQEFDAWVVGQMTPVSDNPAVRGESWYAKFGCKSCHSDDGSVGVGPTFKGLFGKTEELADGTIMIVDEAYLIDAIRMPGKQLVKGFQNIMPAGSENKISDQQLAEIIEFIKTLK